MAFERANGAAIDRTLAGRPPVELYGHYWSGQIQRGLDALPELEPADVLEVRFEELVAQPRAVLERLAEFFELPAAPGSIGPAHGCAAPPPTGFNDIPSDEQQRLAEACTATSGCG